MEAAGLPSAKVKGLPLHLSQAALQDLCSHYGAVRSRPLSGPMKGTMVLEFASVEAARRAVEALSGLRLWNRTLTATLLPTPAPPTATSPASTTSTFATSSSPSLSSPSPLYAQLSMPMPQQPSPPGQPRPPLSAQPQPATHYLPGETNDRGVASPGWDHTAATSHKRPLSGLTPSYEGPTNASDSTRTNEPKLEHQYIYPPIDVNIVANIVRALSEVPQFYTMTLHLMNKLSLPAPFGPQKRANRIPKGVQQQGQAKRRKKTTDQDEDLSTDESELESDSEDMQEQKELISSAVHAFQKVPAPALPTSKKHDTIQIKLGPSITASAAEPLATISSALDGTQASVSTSTASTTQQSTPPTSAEDASVGGRPLTLSELAADRMPISQLLQAKGYEGYSKGEPSLKLRLKNLPRKKPVDPSELLRLFGSFAAPGQSPNDIVIRVMTGRMGGQAFVTLANQELASQALEAVHGYVLHGQPVFVEYGREGIANPTANTAAETNE